MTDYVDFHMLIYQFNKKNNWIAQCVSLFSSQAT